MKRYTLWRSTLTLPAPEKTCLSFWIKCSIIMTGEYDHFMEVSQKKSLTVKVQNTTLLNFVAGGFLSNQEKEHEHDASTSTSISTCTSTNTTTSTNTCTSTSTIRARARHEHEHKNEHKYEHVHKHKHDTSTSTTRAWAQERAQVRTRAQARTRRQAECIHFIPIYIYQAFSPTICCCAACYVVMRAKCKGTFGLDAFFRLELTASLMFSIETDPTEESLVSSACTTLLAFIAHRRFSLTV